VIQQSMSKSEPRMRELVSWPSSVACAVRRLEVSVVAGTSVPGWGEGPYSSLSHSPRLSNFRLLFVGFSHRALWLPRGAGTAVNLTRQQSVIARGGCRTRRGGRDFADWVGGRGGWGVVSP
ncbi:hypothetical protein SK128_022095, partial [Halocaridina rubra]